MLLQKSKLRAVSLIVHAERTSVMLCFPEGSVMRHEGVDGSLSGSGQSCFDLSVPITLDTYFVKEIDEAPKC